MLKSSLLFLSCLKTRSKRGDCRCTVCRRVAPTPWSQLVHFERSRCHRHREGKTSFKVKASKKRVKVISLSKGSSKVRFSVKKVTHGQKSKVKINSKTGKTTLKKRIRKCTIYVKATSKANNNRMAKTKTIKIVVK